MAPGDARHRPLRTCQATVLTIVFAHLLAGGRGGHRGIALLAKDLTLTQRAAFGCWFNRRTKCYEGASEDCVYGVLKAVSVLQFHQAIWAWQKARLGSEDGDVVVLDGKASLGSRGTQLVGAINARSGRTLGVEAVADKSNEIPAGQTEVDRLDLDGTIALMNASKRPPQWRSPKRTHTGTLSFLPSRALQLGHQSV